MPARPVPERFLVAFSFAGEQRESVRAVAEVVEKNLGEGKVFLDEWFEHYIAGADADLRLQKIYAERCALVVVCISERYGSKPWTQAEHAAIRARLMKARTSLDERDQLAILPIRVGDGEVPGILFNTTVPDIRKCTPAAAASFIIDRLRLIIPELGSVTGASAPRTSVSGDDTQRHWIELRSKLTLPTVVILAVVPLVLLVWYLFFFWKVEPQLEQGQKTAVAIGAAFAMLGQSSQAVAPKIFASALKQAGIPPDYAHHLSKAFSTLEDDRQQQGTNANLEHEKKSLLIQVEDELRNVFHADEDAYVRFGHDLVRLTLLLRYWNRLQKDPGFNGEVAKSLGGLQEVAEKVRLSEEVRRGLLNLHESRLNVPEEREIAKQLLKRALRQYDFSTNQD